MARRATKRKSPVKKRRSRVSGVIPKRYEREAHLTGGVVLGTLAAGMLPNIINRFIPNVNPKIASGVQTVGGVLLANMFPKSPLVRGVGIGVGALGALDLARNLGVMPNNTVGANEVILDLDGGMSGGVYRSLAGGKCEADKITETAPAGYVDAVLAGVGLV